MQLQRNVARTSANNIDGTDLFRVKRLCSGLFSRKKAENKSDFYDFIKWLLSVKLSAFSLCSVRVQQSFSPRSDNGQFQQFY